MPTVDEVMQNLHQIGEVTADSILKQRDRLDAEHKEIYEHLTKLADVFRKHTAIAHDRVRDFCRASDAIVEANTGLINKLPHVTYELEALETPQRPRQVETR